MKQNNMDNIAVFTTRFVIDNKSPIVYVSHDKDGAWQFFSKEEAREQDARMISITEILHIDPSLRDILWIPEGRAAWRNISTNEWITRVSSL